MTITPPTVYGWQAVARCADRSIIAGPELSPSGSLVLRVGRSRGDGRTWFQTEHVVLTPDEARRLLGDALALVGATPGRGFGNARDGDVALEVERRLCATVDIEGDGPLGDLYQVTRLLIEAFYDLDHWMDKGGEPPHAWRHDTPPPVITDRAVQSSPPAGDEPKPETPPLLSPRVGDPVVVDHGWLVNTNRSVHDYAGTLRRIHRPDGDMTAYTPSADDEELVPATIEVEGPGGLVDSDVDHITHVRGRPSKVTLTYRVPVDVEVDLVQGRVLRPVVADERLGAPVDLDEPNVTTDVQLTARVAADAEWPVWVIGT